MKCTWLTQSDLYSTDLCWGSCWALKAHVGHYRLALGIILYIYRLVFGARVESASVFRYEHIGIDNANVNAKGFALRWNIGLNELSTVYQNMKVSFV